MSIQTLTSVDYARMREVAKAVYEDTKLFDAFLENPEGVAHSLGFDVPEGYHLHIADAENRLYPAEEAGAFGSEDNTAWSRLEVRAGYKTISLVMCQVK